MIQLLTTDGLVERTAKSLALDGAAISHETIAAQAMRRAVSALAPCSRAEALTFVCQPLADVIAKDRDWYEAILDALIAYGDILEVTPQDSDAWRTGRLVLRPAPPSFVQRSNGDLIILGVAGDQPSALLGDLADHLEHQGTLRSLRQPVAGPVIERLKALGLIELPEAAWLRAPKTTSAESYSDASRAVVSSAPLSTAPLEGLTLIDPASAVTFYAGRWRPPTSGDTGIFVARREQLFGLRPWCLVELERGEPRRLHDLVAPDGPERPCDLAWRIQAAFDAASGRPQRVRVRRTPTTAEFEFFSPLPAFIERRLALKGEKTMRSGCLFAYTMQPAAADHELACLSDKMWLTETQ